MIIKNKIYNLKCHQCNKKFKRKMSVKQYETTERFYCSIKCQRKHWNEQARPKAHKAFNKKLEDPKFRKTLGNGNRGRRQTKKEKEVHARASEKLWKDKEYRETVINNVRQARYVSKGLEAHEFKYNCDFCGKENVKQFGPKSIKRFNKLKHHFCNRGCFTKFMFLIQSESKEKVGFPITSKNEIKIYKHIKNVLKVDCYSQFIVKIGNKSIINDIFIKPNKIIKYDGGFWHCDPRDYSEDFYHTFKKMTAKEIWAKDSKQIKSLEANDYKVLRIWERDYLENKKDVYSKILNFIRS